MTKRRRLALFASLCLALALAVPPIRAAGEGTGSIRVAAAAMTIHRVGDASGALTPEFAGSGADLGRWDDPETARILADHAVSGSTRQADETGYVVFDGLEPGIWLLTGAGSPFLVPIPLTVGEETYYDIIASPKPGTEQPDTGQSLGVGHWLAVSAGALLAMAALRRKK